MRSRPIEPTSPVNAQIPLRRLAIPAGNAVLHGDLTLPARAKGLVIFAHGSGSSRLSPRNRFVAQELARRGLATLLADLLTLQEEKLDQDTRRFRFDIPLLAKRLEMITAWARQYPDLKNHAIGYFGASTGAAAALIAAADHADVVRAVVSRGGRPDLAAASLPRVKAPVLLIVGGRDLDVMRLNQQALERLNGTSRLHVVAGATHLFEETGALENVARLSADWFTTHLAAAGLAG